MHRRRIHPQDSNVSPQLSVNALLLTAIKCNHVTSLHNVNHTIVIDPATQQLLISTSLVTHGLCLTVSRRVTAHDV